MMAKEELPRAPDDEADFSSVHFKNLPVHWESLQDLASLINDLSEAPVARGDFEDVSIPSEAYTALPRVASLVAHHNDEAFPVKQLSSEEIKTLRPWLTEISWVLRRFSEKWADHFERYLERRGAEVLNDAANRIIGIAQTFEDIANPREQFVQEIASLYQDIYDSGQVEWRDHQEKLKPRVEHILHNINSAARAGKSIDQWKNLDRHPLLYRLAARLGISFDVTQSGKATVAATEMMEGVKSFLESHGVEGLQPMQDDQFDLFDLLDFEGFWMRVVAEIFVPEKLQQVKDSFPEILESLYRFLPEDGPAFASKIYELMTAVAQLEAQGQDPREITKAVFQKPS